MDAVRNNTDAADTTKTVDQLNSFLRGEIAAAETYRMAIGKIAKSDRDSEAHSVGLLQGIQEEHQRAISAIRDRIKEMGGEASDSSGAWGAWATSVQGTMNLFGDASALKGLKEGEEHGLKDYQSGHDNVDASTRQLIQNQMIPAQQRHVAMLDQLISTVKG